MNAEKYGTFEKRSRRMDTKTQKQQDSIRRLIQRQYDQLLDLCEQTKAEVDMLSSPLHGGSVQNSAEISKVRDMISLMENDIHKKKEETAKQSIENKYEQLLSFYSQAKDEITVLENALNQGLPSMDLGMKQSPIISHNAFGHGFVHNAFQAAEDLNPRERLNLHPHDPFAEMLKSQPQQPSQQSTPAVVTIPPKPQLPESPIVRPQVPEHLRSITEGLNMHNMAGQPLEMIPSVGASQAPLQPEPNLPEQVPTEETQELYAQPPQPEPIEEPINLGGSVVSASPDISQEQSNEETTTDESAVANEQLNAADELDSPALPSFPEALREIEPPKAWQKALGFVGNISFYAFLLIAIVAVVLFGTQEPDAPPRNLFGFAMMTVLTGSMEPDLPRRSVILIRETDSNLLEVNDVVTYLRETNSRVTTVTHRIIDITEQFTPDGKRGFQLQGDANASPDNEIVRADNVIGQVIWHNVLLGEVIFFIQTVPILFGLLVILFMLLIYVIKAIFKKPDLPEGMVLINGIPVPMPQDPRLMMGANAGTPVAQPHQPRDQVIAPPTVDKKVLKSQKKLEKKKS